MTSQLQSASERQESPLKNRSFIMLFEKPSTRTRTSFEVGIYQLGGQPVPLDSSDIQLSRGEPIKDTARVFSRYGSGVIARVYEHATLEEFAEFSSVPVINALSDYTHPCQALADYYTIQQMKGDLQNVTIAYVGDGNNVCRSLMLGSVLFGSQLRVATPSGYRPGERIWKQANQMGHTDGISIMEDPRKAVDEADVLYTDVWTSMGQEEEARERKEVFQPYQINQKLLAEAKEDAVVMHCLPAHRGEEITNEVMEGEASIVWKQAENRLHAQKGLLTHLCF